jgi:hypothetical protein
MYFLYGGKKTQSYLNVVSVEVTAIGAAPYFKALSYIFQITKRIKNQPGNIGTFAIHENFCF